MRTRKVSWNLRLWNFARRRLCETQTSEIPVAVIQAPRFYITVSPTLVVTWSLFHSTKHRIAQIETARNLVIFSIGVDKQNVLWFHRIDYWIRQHQALLNTRVSIIVLPCSTTTDLWWPSMSALEKDLVGLRVLCVWRRRCRWRRCSYTILASHQCQHPYKLVDVSAIQGNNLNDHWQPLYNQDFLAADSGSFCKFKK